MMTSTILLQAMQAADTLQHVVAEVVSDTTLQQMKTYMETTADNTAFSWLPSGFDLLIGTLGLGFAVGTWFAQKRTEKNTSKLTETEQKTLLVDMMRHLYRNLVVTYGIRAKMEAKGFRVYPSEEHLQKLKVNLADIHLNLFFREDEYHQKMTKLYVMLRNYNLEIDVFCNHFKDPSINEDVKRRDLNSLAVKCSILTKEIMSCVQLIWNKDYETIGQRARRVINGEYESNTRKTPWASEVKLQANDKDSFYNKLFGPDFGPDEVEQFYSHLEEDIRKECGRNEKQADILQMIDLPEK